MKKEQEGLPLEAAQAVLLQDTFFGFSDPEAVEKYNTAKESRKKYEAGIDREDLRRMGRVFTYDSRFKTKENKQLQTIKAEFLQKLTNGTLVAWARECSPLAPMQEIPASAWPLLKLKNVPMSIIKGPNGDLYDVHIGLRSETETKVPKPTTGAPGRPSNMHLVLAEFRNRVESGGCGTSLSSEARFLEAWFEEQHPDKQPVKANSIRNKLRGELNKLPKEIRDACPILSYRA